MGLFDKKYCDFCGEKIGLLGNRKLEDGNMCKDCAAKLSPYLTGRKHETVAAIREHLNYREENKRRLADFHVSRILGKATKIYLDDEKGCFIISRRDDWMNANPDIISLSQVLSCEIPVSESKRQLYTKDKDGKQVPYNPPRYEYSYSFDVKLTVNSPYFSDIRFDLSNDYPDSRNSYAYALLVYEGQAIQHALMPDTYEMPVQPVDPALMPHPHPIDRMDKAAILGTALLNKIEEQKRAEEERKFDDLANDDETPDDKVFDAGIPQAPLEKAAASRWFCPECGTANEGKFCVQCGTARPVPVPRCSRCGYTPEKGNVPRFCPECGNRFED
ncbi:MAG: hypothetical protein CW338_06185 [Clostridiales bacterium]|nr:hypothetical protein [Clostridiales bacterium]